MRIKISQHFGASSRGALTDKENNIHMMEVKFFECTSIAMLPLMKHLQTREDIFRKEGTRETGLDRRYYQKNIARK